MGRGKAATGFSEGTSKMLMLRAAVLPAINCQVIGAEANQRRFDPSSSLVLDGPGGQRHQHERAILAAGHRRQRGRWSPLGGQLGPRKIEGIGGRRQADGVAGLERGERQLNQRRGIAIEHPEQTNKSRRRDRQFITEYKTRTAADILRGDRET